MVGRRKDRRELEDLREGIASYGRFGEKGAGVGRGSCRGQGGRRQSVLASVRTGSQSELIYLQRRDALNADVSAIIPNVLALSMTRSDGYELKLESISSLGKATSPSG